MEMLTKIRELIAAYRAGDWWGAAKIGFALAAQIVEFLSKSDPQPRSTAPSFVLQDVSLSALIGEIESQIAFADGARAAFLPTNSLCLLVLKAVDKILHEIINRLER